MSINQPNHELGDEAIRAKMAKTARQQPSNLIERKQENDHQFRSSGMTPSIITTINNTDPTPQPTDVTSAQLNNNGTSTNPTSLVGRNNRRTSEPYESYIEDSFVGHWEREDDGYEYQEEFDADSQDDNDPNKCELQHPSNIEFDFDSFGPESIIYNPSATTSQPAKPTSLATSSTTRPPPLVEVSTEAEKADELQSDNANEDGAEPRLVPNNIEAQAQTQAPTQAQAQEHHHQHDPVDGLILQTRALDMNYHDYFDPSRIDLKLIEPYKKVISHAGYCHHIDPSGPEPKAGEPAPAVIVFSACYLPDRSRRDYNYVMDHLFLYVLSSLHELIADDYILIYLHNTQPSSNRSLTINGDQSNQRGNMVKVDSQSANNLPTFNWMKRCYQMIDRKLRKNLKILYLVKPTFWLKTIVIMCKPFISTKFSRKLRFVEDKEALRKCIPIDKLILPASADGI